MLDSDSSIGTLPPTNMEVQKGQLTKRKVVFLQGSVHFDVSWWEGSEYRQVLPKLRPFLKTEGLGNTDRLFVKHRLGLF